MGSRRFDVLLDVFRRSAQEKHSQAEATKVPDKGLHLLGAETSGGPVEGRGKVVGEPLSGDLGVDTVGELLSLGVDGGLGLHPDEVGVGGEGDGTVDRALGTTLVAEVALPVSMVKNKNNKSATGGSI